MLRRAGRVWQAALAALAVKPPQLQLACQMLVCYLAVMFLEISGGSYWALEGRPVWAVRRLPGSHRHRRGCTTAPPSCATCLRGIAIVPHPPRVHTNGLLAPSSLQMTIVVVLLETSAGSSIRKALLRLAGTLAGMLAGFAILYFVVLCNGPGHENHPQVGRRLGWQHACVCRLSDGSGTCKTGGACYSKRMPVCAFCCVPAVLLCAPACCGVACRRM